jgi:hypothetical protein
VAGVGSHPLAKRPWRSCFRRSGRYPPLSGYRVAAPRQRDTQRGQRVPPSAHRTVRGPLTRRPPPRLSPTSAPARLSAPRSTGRTQPGSPPRRSVLLDVAVEVLEAERVVHTHILAGIVRAARQSTGARPFSTASLPNGYRMAPRRPLRLRYDRSVTAAVTVAGVGFPGKPR